MTPEPNNKALEIALICLMGLGVIVVISIQCLIYFQRHQ